MSDSKSAIEEAGEIIVGARREAYGPVRESFGVVADGWSVILGASVTAEQVALCMVWLKVCREANKHARDNLVDIIGYTALLDQLTSEDGHGE